MSSLRQQTPLLSRVNMKYYGDQRSTRTNQQQKHTEARKKNKLPKNSKLKNFKHDFEFSITTVIFNLIFAGGFNETFFEI